MEWEKGVKSLSSGSHCLSGQVILQMEGFTDAQSQEIVHIQMQGNLVDFTVEDEGTLSCVLLDLSKNYEVGNQSVVYLCESVWCVLWGLRSQA